MSQEDVGVVTALFAAFADRDVDSAATLPPPGDRDPPSHAEALEAAGLSE